MRICETVGLPGLGFSVGGVGDVGGCVGTSVGGYVGVSVGNGVGGCFVVVDGVSGLSGVVFVGESENVTRRRRGDRIKA